jgi:alpha-L-fucosidase
MLNEDQAKPFTAEDVRFTRKKGTLYVILLDWPKGETSIASLGQSATGDATVERVQMLGGPQLAFVRGADALRLTLPQATNGEFVPVLRVDGRGLA